MRALSLLCLILSFAALLAGCSTPVTEAQARATATITGCWPYGVKQPLSTPTIAGLPTATTLPNVMPTATSAPTTVIYPTCTPIPGTPTVAPIPTAMLTPIPARTPQVPAAIGGPQEIGDPPGMVSTWGRFTRSPIMTFHPQRRTAVVAFLAFGATNDPYNGDVFVRVQQLSGVWNELQSVNTAPVKSFYGGLGLAATPDGVLYLAYGGGDKEGDNHIYLVESQDNGMSWSLPKPIAGLDGRVISLAGDARGDLHLLVVQPEAEGDAAAYAQLPAGASSWQITKHILGMHQLTGELQLLPRSDGSVRRYALLNSRDGHEVPHVTLLWSDDGVSWQQRGMELNRYYHDEQPVPVSLLVAQRGPGLIAVAWGQTPGPGHARSGAFMQISIDGGVTWSREEIIAMHTMDGEIATEGGITVGGFEPALVYDATTDMVVASWVEDDFSKRTPELRGSHIRTVVAGRSLTPEGGWRYVVTPDTAETMQPPVLAGWGNRGSLWGTADGRTHWFVAVDERNEQHRVYAQPIRLTAIFDAGES